MIFPRNYYANSVLNINAKLTVYLAFVNPLNVEELFVVKDDKYAETVCRLTISAYVKPLLDIKGD